VLWTTFSRGRTAEIIRLLREAGDTETMQGFESGGPLESLTTPDEYIAAAIDGSPYIDRKLDAMRAHATQITPDGPFFADQTLLGDSRWATEYYLLAAGKPFPQADGWAADLFAGLS
jgi:N-acetyl-1-D-myo-inositol-2-amino-2-deoxy-alpha-D-glucopyranoside deacetylase